MKKFIILAFCFICLFVSAKRAKAAGNFYTNAEATYTVTTEGVVKVDYKITLTNATTEVYAQQYTLGLNGFNPQGPVVYYNGEPIGAQLEDTPLGANLTVTFPDSVVGEGKSRKFEITFEDKDLLTKAGAVWELNLPRVANFNAFESLVVRLVVPKTLGKPVYITPEPSAQAELSGNNTYYFQKDQIRNAGISLAFGKSQVFSFDITYHLENPVSIPVEQKITIPPDTAYQQVFYESINPKPEAVTKDEDGNWLAHYKLLPRERLDIRAYGYVQIFSDARPFEKPDEKTLFKNLSAQKYWEVNDPEIKNIAKNLGSVEAIYDYVVKNLSYNYSKALPNAKRNGALGALSNPGDSICTEFTDLFVTLTRALGVPAREVNGYAYSENPKIQPLALVADVLHSWPEYWDEKSQTWVAVDPTWGNTTGGRDYFSKLDMRHFAFVAHGVSSTEPISPGSYKLGTNPQKDIYITYAKLPVLGEVAPQVNVVQKNASAFGEQSIEVDIKNIGHSALYDQDVAVYYDGQLAHTENISSILPYEDSKIQFKIPYGPFGTNMPNKATVVYNGNSYDVFTNKKAVIIKHIAVVILTIFAVIGFLFTVLRFNYIKKFFKAKILKR